MAVAVMSNVHLQFIPDIVYFLFSLLPLNQYWIYRMTLLKHCFEGYL